MSHLVTPPRFARGSDERSLLAAIPADPRATCHRVECDVRRELLAEPGYRFSQLVVRRLDHNSVCLQGVMSAADDAPDVSVLLRRVAGVEHVVNQLVRADCRSTPAESDPESGDCYF